VAKLSSRLDVLSLWMKVIYPKRRVNGVITRLLNAAGLSAKPQEVWLKHAGPSSLVALDSAHEEVALCSVGLEFMPHCKRLFSKAPRQNHAE
jgi:hypothetical protein